MQSLRLDCFSTNNTLKLTKCRRLSLKIDLEIGELQQSSNAMQKDTQETLRGVTALLAEARALREGSFATRDGIASLRKSTVLVHNYATITQECILSAQTGIAQTKEDLAKLSEETAREKLVKFIQWLSVTDPSSNHYAACNKRYSETGEWILSHKDFQAWLTDEHSMLWLYGKRKLHPYEYDFSNSILCSRLLRNPSRMR
jgi:hypothetical protein